MAEKILAVDNEADLLALVKRGLEFYKYEVSIAVDGPEALQKAKDEKPNLILLDIMMPKVTGYEICRKLKSDPESKSIPIILMTARSPQLAMNASKESGADDCIFKPFRIDELVSRIKAILAAQKTA
jgi:DNA-binding response OmpR family regulator